MESSQSSDGVRKAVVITGNYDDRCNLQCIRYTYENIIKPNNMDVFIFVNALKPEYVEEINTWGDCVKMLEYVNVDRVANFFTPHVKFLFDNIAKQVNGNDDVTRLCHNGVGPGAPFNGMVVQFLRLADACNRMKKYTVDTKIVYDCVLRWRFDIVYETPFDLTYICANLKDKVWVLRLEHHEFDKCHEILMAKWEYFYNIYTSYVHWMFRYWPLRYNSYMTLAEIQFAQHLRQFPYEYVEYRFRSVPNYFKDRHYVFSHATPVDVLTPMRIDAFGASDKDHVDLRVSNPLLLDRILYESIADVVEGSPDEVTSGLHVRNENAINTTEVTDQLYFALFIAFLTLFVVSIMIHEHIRTAGYKPKMYRINK